MNTNLIKRLTSILASVGVGAGMVVGVAACKDKDPELTVARNEFFTALKEELHLKLDSYSTFEFSTDGANNNVLTFNCKYQQGPNYIYVWNGYYMTPIFNGYDIDNKYKISYNVSMDDYIICTQNTTSGKKIKSLTKENVNSLTMIINNYEPFSILINGEEAVIPEEEYVKP